jgi:hypothetical protein
MFTKRKVTVAALATVALGGVGVGTAFASTAVQAPAAVTSSTQVSAVSAETPRDVSGQPDAPESGEAPEAGEKADGPDTDKVQHEATGDEGNHADEPGAKTGEK